jgi:two-component system cell cycle sensor histidine kinase/response regulator CckA
MQLKPNRRQSQVYVIRLFGSGTASRLVVLLGVWSVFWVVCSDYILSLFVEAPPVLWSLESVEGVIYVSVSGVIAGFLVKQLQREHDHARIANESKLRSIQAAGLIGIFTWRNGSITDANDAFLNMVGFTRADLAAGKLKSSELVAPEYRQVETQALMELAEKRQSDIYQEELIRKDGARMFVVGGRALIEGATGHGIGYALDITPLVIAQREQKQLEEQLQGAHRMNALGQLAGGIVHDFNNLLGIIVGYTALMNNGPPANHVKRENAVEVLKAAEKARALARKLLTFSQKQAPHAELLDVNATLSELEKMLSRVLGDTIALRLLLDDGVGCVLADSTQIEQIVMNLVVNARDAMPSGGVITIATGQVRLEPHTSGLKDVHAGDYVSIKVSDQGIGMCKEVLDHVFEPFFSTKKSTGGTGLGLAIVDGIVKQSGGHVLVESRPGEGTEFTVLLPWAAERTRQVAPCPGAKVRGGAETILLMEDAEEMRRMLTTILGSLGYTVLPAQDGQHGVEIARQYPETIHLVLADVAMPRLSGPDAIQLIRGDRPGVKAMLLTGFADPRLLEGRAIEGTPVLEKPIAPDVLAARIREVLGPNHKN